MQLTTLLMAVAVVAVLAYYVCRRRSLVLAGPGRSAATLHSLPSYYGYYAVFLAVLPALLISLVWVSVDSAIIAERVLAQFGAESAAMSDGQRQLALNDIRNVAAGNDLGRQASPEIQALAEQYSDLNQSSRRWLSVLVLAVAFLGAAVAFQQINPGFRARNRVEATIKSLLFVASCIAVLTTVGIVFSVLFETARFFEKVAVSEFLFGLEWSPQMAIRADQVGASGAFGAVPLIVGTLLITFIAMLVAVPIGLMTAVYLSEYAAPKFRSFAKPLLEVLAGIPTVVYGFFAALSVAPFVRTAGEAMGLTVSSESALAAGLVMGIMIIPLVSSLSDDAIAAVPMAMRDGALGLGATRSEAVRNVIIPAALPGIVGGILLAVSRAIGETMIVVMAAGLAANLTLNPLDAVTTVTVQIVTLLQGDQEFDSAKTLAAFALGLLLFAITLALNVVGLRVVRKYREQYE
ncbi:MAG: phosphate ABC transporter permease subunit PstC [Pseudomonadota bacterium]